MEGLPRYILRAVLEVRNVHPTFFRTEARYDICRKLGTLPLALLIRATNMISQGLCQSHGWPQKDSLAHGRCK